MSVTMIRKLIALYRRAIYIFRTEGFISLCKKIAFVPIHLARSSVFYNDHYIYEHKIQERNEIDFLPKISNLVFRITSTKQQVDELTGEGFNLPPDIIDAMHILDKGAIALCIFVDSELAHINWVCLTQEAKDILDPIPYNVDFSNNEVCGGGAVTPPKYQGKGLMTYGYFKRLQSLSQMGKTVLRNSVNSDNTASLWVQAKFGGRRYAVVRLIKVFWWRFYIKKPLA